MTSSVLHQHRFPAFLSTPTSNDCLENKIKGIRLCCEKKRNTGFLYSQVKIALNGKVKAEINPHKQVISDGDGIGIARFVTGKVFFITGATGFLAKVLVEKILRGVPEVSRIYLLINAKDNEAAVERLKKEILNTELFKHMKESQGEYNQTFLLNKLVPVVGNICEPGLGMELDVADLIADEADVIVNSAGDTTFDQRYDVAMDVNTLGPCRLLSFAKRCKELKLFLHVSTAYVNGQREGIIQEKKFKIGDSIAREKATLEILPMSIPLLDVEAELKMALDARESFQGNSVTKKMKHLGLERARTFGWQDTYTFTKAMGEMLLEREKGDIPIVIIRPSIIESTYSEPIPGWIEGIRMLDPILISYGKGDLTGFPSDANTVIDMIPADMVVNAILAAIVKHATERKPGLSVYHVASSVVNPLLVQDLFTYSFEYFSDAPYMDIKQNPISIKRVKLFKSLDDFDTYIESEKASRTVKHLANMYEAYGFYKGRFDITNTEKLRAEMSHDEKRIYGFDVRSIDWKSYWCNIHIPGLMTHVVQRRGKVVIK